MRFVKPFICALGAGVMFLSAGVALAQGAVAGKAVTLASLSAQPRALNVSVERSSSSTKTSAKPAAKKQSTTALKKSAGVKNAPKKRAAPKKQVARTKVRRTAPSQAMLAGLRNTPDPLELKSSVAYIVDQDTGEELFNKNADIELPIASVTKLMTALIVAESGLSMKEKIRITRDDYVRSRALSKLRNGMVLTRGAVLNAALMSSDNRAAHALARTYPGGIRVFIQKMNEKAKELGMEDSFFADPTGLNNDNHSTARDLGKLVAAAHQYEDIRRSSTMPAARLRAGRYVLDMHTTNRLIGDPRWHIGVQKTGFTTAAGRCMVVQSELADRRVVMVVLDSPDNNLRARDMQVMREYVEQETSFNKSFSQLQPYELF